MKKLVLVVNSVLLLRYFRKSDLFLFAVPDFPSEQEYFQGPQLLFQVPLRP